MQAITAECLNMERGVSSDKKHLSAMQYKNKMETEKAEQLQKDIEQLNRDPEKLDNLAQFIARFGYRLRTSGTKTDVSKSINHLLDDIFGVRIETVDTSAVCSYPDDTFLIFKQA